MSGERRTREAKERRTIVTFDGRLSVDTNESSGAWMSTEGKLACWAFSARLERICKALHPFLACAVRVRGRGEKELCTRCTRSCSPRAYSTDDHLASCSRSRHTVGRHGDRTAAPYNPPNPVHYRFTRVKAGIPPHVISALACCIAALHPSVHVPRSMRHE